jgi:hypothetical protein
VLVGVGFGPHAAVSSAEDVSSGVVIRGHLVRPLRGFKVCKTSIHRFESGRRLH